ncbi:MAG: glycosyl transferase [Thermoleophilia bacterium]|nr:glycosyl transferase [Thermoleophilia bacterium]
MPAPTDLWVVIPAYNEERWIETTLGALTSQRSGKPFTVLVVDNASTDDTARLVTDWAAAHPDLDLRLLAEPEKGTGAASDSGFRHAIEHGAAFILRTDADSIPAPDWVACMRRALDGEGIDLVGGRVLPRSDDGTSPRGAVVISAIVAWLMRHTGRFNRINRGPQFQCTYTLVPGFNLGMRAEAYLASGGFPRTRIEDAHEDWELTNRVRTVSSRVRYRSGPLVRYSNRRVARHGVRNVIRWYTRHDGPVVDQVDVR